MPLVDKMKVHLECSCSCIVAHYVVPAYIPTPLPHIGEEYTISRGGGLKDSKQRMKLNCNTWNSTGEGIIEQIPPLGVQGYGYFLELLIYHHKSVQKHYLLKSNYLGVAQIE